jgi:hypothetical protein
VGLVPFIPAQMSKDLAMSVGRAGHEKGQSKSSCAPSSTHRFAVAEELDFFPEFVAQGAEHAGFRVADARGSSGAERAEGKSDLARFLVDCAQALASARSSASVTTLSICAELTSGSLDATR